MTSQELRQKYLDFFKSKGHTIIPSASLIPENDPTVLFTTAGMHPLVPYLLGEKHPGGKRLVSCQKCIRTGDIDEVGDDVHLTFFEMLGNWSLGDYWKKEAIEWSFEFLTKALGLSKDKIAISCFEGEKKNNIEKDDESAKLWQAQGIPKERIVFLGRDDNWWGPAGQTGPCGPDTEMFYWAGKDPTPKVFDPKDKSWVEIWNDVFMQYNKTADDKYEPLKQKNVDTGMGLERTLAVLNGKESVYETELFLPIIKKIEQLAPKASYYPGDKAFDRLYQPRIELEKNLQKMGTDAKKLQSIRIIADHLRAATFIIGDTHGVGPSNIGQGYVVRRLIRRAIRYGKIIGVKDNLVVPVAEVVISISSDVYPELHKNKDFIINELKIEEEKFSIAIEKGLKKLNDYNAPGEVYLNGVLEEKFLPSYIAFDLYQTYGVPIEMIKEIAAEKGLKVHIEDFEIKLKEHQKLSRTASAGKFKGGLADNSEIVVKYHTATHLLHQALRQVLGGHVAQKGSNITPERLRFDFSHPAKMTPEEISQVEKIVNEKIKEDLPVHFEMLSVEDAKARGAIGLFEDKYAKLGSQVKVYFVGDYSAEICGGPHVEHTGQIGSFKIIKEEAVSAGVRRIKATVA